MVLSSLDDLDGSDVLETVSKAIEGSPLTNTGYGSSVASDGHIYCDSSVQILDLNTGKSDQSTVVRNSSRYPIADALDQLQRNRLCDRRKTRGITPSLVTISSKQPDDSLLTDGMALIYRQNPADCADDVSDTIGCCHITDNQIAVASSSGGSLFKDPGRIGCSGVPGASCYTTSTLDLTAAVLCSGNGEDIIQMDLARAIAEHLTTTRSKELVCKRVASHVHKLAKAHHLQAVNDQYAPELYVGVLGYLADIREHRRYVFYFHTTESFAFAYKHRDHTHWIMSRLDSSKERLGEFFLPL